MQSASASGLDATVKKGKKQDKSKQKQRGKKELARAQAKIAHLELERNQAISNLKALEELAEKLPEIFERKFTQRLAPVLEHQRLLLEENARLQAQVDQLMTQLGDAELNYSQTNSRPSIAFIGLTPATASSLQPLADEQVSESVTTGIRSWPVRFNVA